MEGDQSISIEIAIIFILILANGVFAMTEIAVVSSRKARLERLAAEGSAGAKAALELASEPTQLLSTVQVGISVISVVTGAFGGATIAKALAAYFQFLPFIGKYANAISMVVVISSITYVSLIVGELVPKKIALNTPEPIAVKIALPMRFFAKVFSPLVSLLTFSTEYVLKILGIKEPQNTGVTEEEIRIMLVEGTASGTFEEAEKDIVDRVFRLGDMRAASLMTPRTQIAWLDLEESDEYNWTVITENPHTRLPVARGTLDDIIGVVYVRDLLADRQHTRLPIKENIQQPLFVPRSLRALKLLEQFKQTGMSIAFVMDEFGGIIGIVTIHDIIEELVGELLQEADADPDIIQRSANSWLIDGLYSIEEFKEQFNIAELPNETKDHYHTLGGFITSYLGGIPKAGDTFQWANLSFEIVDMDRMRIDKVIVNRLDTINTE